jgi:hypothetical protein
LKDCYIGGPSASKHVNCTYRSQFEIPLLAQPHDREFYERELASFLPDRIFDAHTHLWRDKPYNSMFKLQGQ